MRLHFIKANEKTYLERNFLKSFFSKKKFKKSTMFNNFDYSKFFPGFFSDKNVALPHIILTVAKAKIHPRK